MCLAVPGRIVEIHDDRGLPMATIDFGGIRKEVCLVYLPDAAVGDFAIVHVGVAIAKVDEASARRTLALFAELGASTEDLAEEDGAVAEEDAG